MPIRIDLGKFVQGAIIFAFGVIFLLIWIISLVRSILTGYSTSNEFLILTLVFFLGGTAIAYTGFRFKRRV